MPRPGTRLRYAPLVVKDKVLVGVAGGEYGIRGFITAYDARTGKEAWRFYTIPGPGEAGHETWRANWTARRRAGWLTGSYDPDLNLTTGAPAIPDRTSTPRCARATTSIQIPWSRSIADTGKLKWHFQFTPNDAYDYDSVQIPVLVDIELERQPAQSAAVGQSQRVFLRAGSNRREISFRATRSCKVNWASGLDDAAGPFVTPSAGGHADLSRAAGRDQLVFAVLQPAHRDYSIFPSGKTTPTIFNGLPAQYKQGQRYTAGANTGPIPGGDTPGGAQRGPINTYTEAVGHGAVIAIDPRTGDKKWSFPMHDVTTSGILTTATDLLFTGGREGYFQALHARTGELLWKASLGGDIIAGPITYEVSGKQYISVAAGRGLFVFALRN